MSIVIDGKETARRVREGLKKEVDDLRARRNSSKAFSNNGGR